MLVRSHMSRRVITVEPQRSAAEVRGLLQRHRIRQLPVMRKGRLVGIVTDRDLRGVRDSKRSVADVMTAKPFVVSPTASVDEAARLLRSYKIGALPVVDGGVGRIITASDLLDAFVRLSVAEPRHPRHLRRGWKAGGAGDPAHLLDDHQGELKGCTSDALAGSSSTPACGRGGARRRRTALEGGVRSPERGPSVARWNRRRSSAPLGRTAADPGGAVPADRRGNASPGSIRTGRSASPRRRISCRPSGRQRGSHDQEARALPVPDFHAELRKKFCGEEVRLNRRWRPRPSGVVGIRQSSTGTGSPPRTTRRPSIRGPHAPAS